MRSPHQQMGHEQPCLALQQLALPDGSACTFNGGGFVSQASRDSHLAGSAAGNKPRIPDNIPCHAHGIVKVALDLIQHVF